MWRSAFPRILGVLLFLALALVACNSPGSTSTAMPTAQQLLSSAQAAIQKVTSYHFNLMADNPGTNTVLTIKSADGDVLVPDKLKANANALVLGNVVQVQLVSIGDKQYITDPISGQWTPTSGLLDPRSLADTKTGVAAIISNIQNPSTPTDSSIDGTPCWNIDGQLDVHYLKSITGVDAPTGTKVAVTTCIGKSDNLPYLLRVNGKAVEGDTDKTVRTFKLSKFNEQITIVAPI